MSRPRPPLRSAIALLLLCHATLGSAGAAASPPEPPIPLADFFRSRAITQPLLNGAGTHLAALVNRDEDRTDLVVFDLAAHTSRRVALRDDLDIAGFVWLGDDRLLFQTVAEKLYGSSLSVATVADPGHSYPLLERCSVRLLCVPPADPLHPLVWLRSDPFSPGADGEAVVLDAALNTGPGADRDGSPFEVADSTAARDANERHILRRYPRPPGLSCSYTADVSGRLTFAYTCDAGGVLSVHELDGGRWVRREVDLDQLHINSPGENPGELLVCGPRRADRPRQLLALQVASGRFGRVVYADPAHDFVGTVYRAPDSGQIIGYFDEAAAPRNCWFTEAGRALQARLDARFPGLATRIVSTDRAMNRTLVAVYSDRQPADYYLSDAAAGTIELFRRSAPWVDPARMNGLRMLSFETCDGRQLDAYLTLPEAASPAHPVPLVVLPHGGPWLQEIWAYDDTAQFLASRGYAVLQPNYRGSTGHNWKFPEADQWDFRKMGADVTAAARAAFATGVIDRGRTAIMGSSFGGYLALAGAADEPELYCCAVTIGGVFDWARVIARMKTEQSENAQYAYLRRKLGDPAQQRAHFESISPVRRVDRIRIPVFVAHGQEDWIADASESRRLIAALRRRHVPVESFLPAGEGHGMSHLQNRLELYRRIEEFLAKNLAPRSQPLATAER